MSLGRWALPTSLILLAMLSGCSVFRQPHVGELSSLESISELTQESVEASFNLEARMRNDMLKETALSLGARGGLAARLGEINTSLEKRSDYLDTIFNFRALVLKNNVLPPVLVEGRNTLNLENSQEIRISDRTFRIEKQARFITAPPTWRSYLLLQASPPAVPDPSLLPDDNDRDEVNLWKEYTEKGWEQGIQQANGIYAENLGRLKRDYKGMIRYRKLLAQGMVSPPEVAIKDLGVTGGGAHMSVNDRVLTIRALPALKANSKEWEAAATK
jgi:defect-in-organelle-trafficking protein DotC